MTIAEAVNRILVQSALIKTVAFDAATETMLIEFHDGEMYEYLNVSEELYDGLIGATSIGTYFNSKIRRNNSCPCRRIA